MPRMIDADKLKDALTKVRADALENFHYCQLIDDDRVRELIDKQPTIKLPQWVDPRKLLPTVEQPVLVYLWNYYYVGYYDIDFIDGSGIWRFEEFSLYGENVNDVVAWRPLPNPPEWSNENEKQ